jgi:predicted amidohydrolase
MSKSFQQESNFMVASLQLKTAPTYQENLDILITHILNSPAHLIVAPELCLTNFDYEHFEEVASFYDVALAKLLEVVHHKIVILTLTKKEGNHFFNQAIVLHNHQIVHTQNKHKLFTLGKEEHYFKAGEKESIVKFTIEGVTYALLICFELRFKTLWQQIEGADMVIVPARWGKSRKKHLEVLAQALAIMNQTFVVVSNSADDDMASSSAIISPWGEVTMNDERETIEAWIHLKEVKKVRRMIQMR